MKRLYAQMVSAGKECLGLSIPGGEGEHALQTLECIFLPMSDRLQSDFGVAHRAENTSARFQLLPQRPKVVYLAVEYDGVALV